MLLGIFTFLIFALIVFLVLFRSILYTILSFLASAIDRILPRRWRVHAEGKTTVRSDEPAGKGQKIFSESDGEYVDFEEVGKKEK